MHIIAFITHSADIIQVLNYIRVDSQPPRISAACGPPLWEVCDAQIGWDLVGQLAPDYEIGQGIN
jgi:hypothetical protein